VMWVMANLVSAHLETVLGSVQDGCTVCAKRTIGMEIVLDKADGTPRCVAHVESHFDPFHDGVSVRAR
jgi:hypothetical protein